MGAKGHRSFTWVLSPFWYCVCLFEMVRILSTLPNVFKAITMRSQQLAQTFLLGIYVWWVHVTRAQSHGISIPLIVSSAFANVLRCASWTGS